MIIDAILKRHSVRSYKGKRVSRKFLNEVIEAGRLAPSAANIQPWKFIVVKDKELRKGLSKACNNQEFLAEAPVIIAGCITAKGFSSSSLSDFAILDIGIALDHMTLQAANLGLGTCWIGAFDEAEVKKLLQIPANVHVVALLTLGFPKDSSISGKRRKNFDEIVSYEKFS